jgi:hypothetical protein
MRNKSTMAEAPADPRPAWGVGAGNVVPKVHVRLRSRVEGRR